MSSDRLSDGPSPPPDGEIAELARERGAPLLEALESHAPGAREHADASASYAFVAAVELGCAREQCEVGREMTRLHDVGLVYVPVATLTKPASARDAEETAAYEGHFEAAYRLARGAGIPEGAAGWLVRQRERFDGSGPDGLAGEEIPLEARLIRAACLCHTVLTSPHSRAAAPREVAIEALRVRAGRDLDPRVAGALAAILERTAAG
jgi:HD-GYP domain-containing protein (c-di-GMP phosphodiesterase class II)